MKKFFTYLVWILILILPIFLYFKFYFVYAQGNKAGILSSFQKKGVVTKTWEGVLVQAGFKVNVQSPILQFSVTDPTIAHTLELDMGKEVNLQYKKYLGTLPWRGESKYIVDSIILVPTPQSPNFP